MCVCMYVYVNKIKKVAMNLLRENNFHISVALNNNRVIEFHWRKYFNIFLLLLIFFFKYVNTRADKMLTSV